MITLFLEELARARRREVVRFVVLAGVAGVLLGCSITGVRSHRPIDADWAGARQSRQEAVQDCMASNSNPGASATDCDPGPPEIWLPPGLRVFDLTSILDTVVWSSLVLGLAGWLLGGALVGADWTSGTIATLLTWEPRRLRLLVAKLAAAGVLAFAIAIALLGMLVAGLFIVAATRGLNFAYPDFWGLVGAACVRVAIVSSIAAVTAGALAFVSRSATFAVASLFVYLVAVEGPLALRLPSVGSILMGQNAAAWVTGRTWGAEFDVVPGMPPIGLRLFDATALGLMMVWVTLVVATACWRFRSRDVV
jgi:ABC-2 type transport system permease protein